jgi:pSer/pThr/pTyr-binding forkhead associated (FHA) protein
LGDGTSQPRLETYKGRLEEEASKDQIRTSEFGLKFISSDGSEHLFARLPISIGRGKENDLIVDDPTVSDVHAAVYFDELVHDVCISDQDSFNGLGIDGMPTRKNVLHDGVTIYLGASQICFRDTGYIHNH